MGGEPRLVCERVGTEKEGLAGSPPTWSGWWALACSVRSGHKSCLPLAGGQCRESLAPLSLCLVGVTCVDERQRRGRVRGGLPSRPRSPQLPVAVGNVGPLALKSVQGHMSLCRPRLGRLQSWVLRCDRGAAPVLNHHSQCCSRCGPSTARTCPGATAPSGSLALTCTHPHTLVYTCVYTPYPGNALLFKKAGTFGTDLMLPFCVVSEIAANHQNISSFRTVVVSFHSGINRHVVNLASGNAGL